MKEETNIKNATSWAAIYVHSREGNNSHSILHFTDGKNRNIEIKQREGCCGLNL